MSDPTYEYPLSAIEARNKDAEAARARIAELEAEVESMRDIIIDLDKERDGYLWALRMCAFNGVVEGVLDEITRAVADLRHSVEGRNATGLLESVIQRLERILTPRAKP